MPYSIQTKDGIKINNIPDDIAPDSQQLKDRVRQIREDQKRARQIREGQKSAPSQTIEQRLKSLPSDPFEGLSKEQVTEIESRFPMKGQRRMRSTSGAPMSISTSDPLVIKDRERAARLEQIRAINPALAAEIEQTGGLEAFLIGAGRGLSNLASGVGIKNAEDGLISESSKLFADQSGAFSGGELAGETAPFLAVGGPAASIARTTLGKTLTTGALGGAEGGIISRGRGGSGEEVLASTLLGSALGGGAELAIPVIRSYGGELIRRLTSKNVDAFDDAGNLTQDATEALKATGISEDDFLRKSIEGADLSRDQKEQILSSLGGESLETDTKRFFEQPQGFEDLRNKTRQEAFEKLGIAPTVPQVTRDPELFQIQVDIFRDAEKDNAVRKHLVDQERLLSDRVSGKVSAIGGDPVGASSAIDDAITNKSLELDAIISGLYKAARERSPDAKNVRFSSLAKTLRENAPIDKRSDDTVSAMRDEAKRLGFLDERGLPTRKTSVEAAEGLRIFANKLYDGANPLARSALRDFKDAIDDDVLRASGEDVFKQARAAKRDFMKGLEATRGHKFDKNTKSLVRDVLEGKVAREDIAKKIISRGSTYKVKQIKELRKYLFSGTPEQIAVGAKAWNDVRASALEEIKDKAFAGPLNELGSRSLSRAGLQKAFDAIGRDKLGVLFSPEEIGFLKDLAQVAAFKEPVAGVKPSPSKPAIERALMSFMPLKLKEWVPDIAEKRVTKAQERAILDLEKKASRISRQHQNRFKAALERSLTLGTTAAGLGGASAAAAGDEKQ